ncbi:hypothetical protein ACFWD7_49110 [Streptomyces mirabilis]|uniref:hypothetical protein n=1 Tax=Streptomyces mirabilis TaxID=68239 RepID=UPI0021BE1AE9|nr:hypothetical protein [Streptomyces mirabilis]MCT9112654.1 hypothetical protein [Streptomyces mirabilis]
MRNAFSKVGVAASRSCRPVSVRASSDERRFCEWGRRVTLAPSALGGHPALEIEPEDGAIGGTILYFHDRSWVFGSPATN